MDAQVDRLVDKIWGKSLGMTHIAQQEGLALSFWRRKNSYTDGLLMALLKIKPNLRQTIPGWW